MHFFPLGAMIFLCVAGCNFLDSPICLLSVAEITPDSVLVTLVFKVS